MSWTSLVLRHLRGSAARWAALAAVVAVTSALVLVWPRWLDRTATSEMHRDLGSASAPLVDPSAVVTWLPVSWGDGTTEAEAEAAMWRSALDPLRAHRDSLPEPLRSLVGNPFAHAILGPVAAPDPAITDLAYTGLQPTVSSGLAANAVYVEGRPPAYESADPEVYDTLFGADPPDVLRLEIAVSVRAAQELRWQVGGVRTLSTALPGSTRIEAVLVGTFEADDETSGFWQHSGLLLRPTVEDNPNAGIVVTARAVVAPGLGAAIAPLLSQPESARLWFPLDTAGVTGANAATVARQLETELATVDQEFGLPLQVATEAPAIIGAVLGRRVATEAVLALAVAAPAGVLLALLALAAQVIIAPRQGSLNLVRERGAAGGQTRRLLAAEAALVCVPAAGLGAALAVVALPAAMSPAWWAAPAVIAAAPVGSLLGGSRTRPRLRLVAEIALAFLAVAGIVVLAQRGVTAAGVDPLGVATPLLLAIVVAVVCTRLLPLALRPLADRLHARADLVAPLGSALAARRRPSTVAAMAMLAGTAVAVLGVLASATLTEARQEAALRDVGADVRVTGYLDDATLDRLRALPGVTAVAGLTQINIVPLSGESAATGFTTVYAVDAALAEVQAAVPGAVAVPLADPTGAVVSGRLGPAVGDEIGLHLGGPVTAEVTAVAATAPGITTSGSWVLVDRQVLLDAGQSPRTTTTFLAVAPGADVVAAVRDVVGPVPTVRALPERVAELTEAPTARALGVGLLVVGAVGLASAAAAVALGLARRESDRTRVVAVLRTMGLPPRAEFRLVLWEVVPTLIVALVAGVTLGFALAGLLLVTTDLRPFTGGAAQPGLVIDPGGLAAALGLVLVVAAVAVVVSAGAAAGRSAAVVLRAGEEPT